MQFAQVERSGAEDGLGVVEAVPPPQIRPLSPITKGKEGGQEDREDLEKKIWKDLENHSVLPVPNGPFPFALFGLQKSFYFPIWTLGESDVIDHRLFYSTK